MCVARELSSPGFGWQDYRFNGQTLKLDNLNFEPTAAQRVKMCIGKHIHSETLHFILFYFTFTGNLKLALSTTSWVCVNCSCTKNAFSQVSQFYSSFTITKLRCLDGPFQWNHWMDHHWPNTAKEQRQRHAIQYVRALIRIEYLFHGTSSRKNGPDTLDLDIKLRLITLVVLR